MRRMLGLLGVVIVLGAACGGSADATPTSDAISTAEATPTVGTTAAGSVETPPAISNQSNLVYATRIRDGATLTLDLYVPAEPLGAPIVLPAETSMIWDLLEAGAIVATFDEDDNIPETFGPEELDFPVDDDHPEAFLYSGHGAPIRAIADRFACAINLVRARSAELGNDDPTLVLTGVSAGAGAAAHVGLLGDTLEARWDEFEAAGGPPRVWNCAVTDGSTHVDAVLGTAGGYNFWIPVFDQLYGPAYLESRDPELLRFLSSSFGSNLDLRFRLIHGTADDGIPFDNSVRFAAELSDAGYDVGEVIPFNGGHVPPPSELLLSTVMEVLGL